MCIADDTKWLFFSIVPPHSAGEQYTTKLGYSQNPVAKARIYGFCDWILSEF